MGFFVGGFTQRKEFLRDVFVKNGKIFFVAQQKKKSFLKFLGITIKIKGTKKDVGLFMNQKEWKK